MRVKIDVLLKCVKYKGKMRRRPQCGNLMIFRSLRFYVKSILSILEVENLPF